MRIGGKMSEKKDYKAEDIKVLEGLEGIRMRPSMYIGSTGKEGLHHLVYEVVDNSVDEAMAGFCKKILVTIHKDDSVTVEDDGRGIPVDMHPIYKKPALEIVITKLHAGGKFDKKSYQISGGLHGVGISVVAALSKKLIATIKRDGKIYKQEYEIGKPSTSLKTIGSCDKNETGTTITFFPDTSIFPTTDYDFNFLATRFREIAFLNAGVKIVLKDERKDKQEDFQYEGGLIEFVKWLNKSKEIIHKPVYFKKQTDSTIVEIAVQYNTGYQENIFGFVNTINTVEGGTHIIGFKTALTRVINDYAQKQGILKTGNLTGDDVREGLTAIVSIKIPNPQFEGQTKTKLGNSEIKGILDSIVSAALSEFFEENPQIAKKIAQKAFESAKARIAASKAKDLVRRKSAFGSGGLPGKLADCSSKKKEKTELYLVEGESAGGCFSGDTKVALADGRNLSFIELVKENGQGKENFCYTIKENGSIGIAKIENPRITKTDAEVIKITLDNNQEIACTPNHKFMLRNGKYKEAEKLTNEDSIMPLYKQISKIEGKITIDGYEMVFDMNKKWIFTHILTDEFNLSNKIYSKKQGDHKHHIDFNKLNNNPSNIIRIPKEEHLIIHTQHLDKTLHREDVKEKARAAHRNLEYRKKVSEWAKQPEIQKMLSERAKEQWKNQEYKDFITQKFKEFYNSNEDYRKKNNQQLDEQQKKYWADEKNRIKASEKVKKFFEENPDAKEYLSSLAKEQWKDETLIVWRREKTREQWTPDFREKRKIAYNRTYFEKTIKLMKKVIENEGNLNNFDRTRIENNDKNILSLKTFCSRFFNNSPEEMQETVKNYNHKIKRIEFLSKRLDVYDLEVKETHNFALASGVFVHNSAKMARNKEYQAILPLKGKILNVEKASPIKVLSSEEITNLITAIGTSVREEFNLEKLRYNKVIIMTDADVDGSHIRTLLLTFFFRFMPHLIETGHVFIAVSPLYKIRKKEDIYVYSDKELEKVLDKTGNSNVTRFKGLGEMNPQQLWDTTMNPSTRMMKKVTVDDAVEADRIFSILMGDDVEPRKQFIIEKAHEAFVDI
ncbi:MAG: DNA topoisomerase (ATP-hydrolyzing) subunit B [Candidatus Pacearchaeota archaeon]|nr:DNA topoisomerase (ATP-hydrolyzing) subunit B [Candidatus Pacearchaeota archaeon]